MKSHLDMDLLDDVIRSLANQEELDPKYKGHPLSGNRKSFMECHIRPDWLLIYKIANDKLILTLARTGSHSNLFGK
ncbi:MAG: type II toxin-antitoxin system YafQ family toxin [Candidatus Enterosoma sp.]|nr:type II toxin-antitoxin system YafQ family toxin [Mollicutes bacterium]MDY5852110.1 type II toxin-antitoxin system YafQ family toxin [Candidatus Enterosoma sp.]